MLIYGLRQLFNIYMAVLAFRVVSIWLSLSSPKSLIDALALVTDPYLNLFSGMLPKFFGVDSGFFVAILAMSVLQFAICSLFKNLLCK